MITSHSVYWVNNPMGVTESRAPELCPLPVATGVTTEGRGSSKSQESQLPNPGALLSGPELGAGQFSFLSIFTLCASQP